MQEYIDGKVMHRVVIAPWGYEPNYENGRVVSIRPSKELLGSEYLPLPTKGSRERSLGASATTLTEMA